jgi:hypothetical protein
MTSFRVREGFTIKTLPDGDAVVSSESGMDAVIVNASAHAVLDLLSVAMTEDDLISFMCETFPQQDPAAIRGDITTLVQQLVQAGIVEPCGNAASTA